MRILITGAAGFLGSRIVRLLAGAGHSVVAADLAHAVRGRLKGVDAGFAVVDLCDRRSLEKVFEEYRPEAVVNCAAYGVNPADRDYRTAAEVNILGAVRVAECAAAAGTGRLIHVGSCFEYGMTANSPVDETAQLRPTAPYGVTKAGGTMAALECGTRLNVPVCVVRPFGIWGDGEEPHRLPTQVIRACQTGKPLALTECTQVRDVMHVDDYARIFSALVSCETFPAGEIINAGSGRPVELREFVVRIADVLNGSHLMRFGELPFREGEMPYLVAATARLSEVVPEFRPAKEQFTERIRRMVSESVH